MLLPPTDWIQPAATHVLSAQDERSRPRLTPGLVLLVQRRSVAFITVQIELIFSVLPVHIPRLDAATWPHRDAWRGAATLRPGPPNPPRQGPKANAADEGGRVAPVAIGGGE